MEKPRRKIPEKRLRAESLSPKFVSDELKKKWEKQMEEMKDGKR